VDLADPWLFAVILPWSWPWQLWLLVIRSGLGGGITYLWLMLVAASTALSMFAIYAMPDVWAGIATIIVFC